jgi:hypothetical protein
MDSAPGRHTRSAWLLGLPVLFASCAPQASVDKSDRQVRTLAESRKYRPAGQGVWSVYWCPIADSSSSSLMRLSDGKPALAILAVSPSRGSLGAPAFQPARRRRGSMPRRRRLGLFEGTCATGRPAAHDGRSRSSSAAGRAPGASSPRRAKPAESRRSQSVPTRGRGSPASDSWSELAASQVSKSVKSPRSRRPRKYASVFSTETFSAMGSCS